MVLIVVLFVLETQPRSFNPTRMNTNRSLQGDGSICTTEGHDRKSIIVVFQGADGTDATRLGESWAKFTALNGCCIQ